MEKIIITIAAIILGMGGMAGGSAVDSNSIVEDGIEYYMQTDKAIYNLGEDVEMLYRVTNLREEDAIFSFTLDVSEQCLFTVEEEGIRIWGRRINFDRVASGFVLNPGEFEEYTGIWNMTADNGTLNPDDDWLISPGTYDVVGRLNLTGGTYIGDENTRVSVLVTITPEPAMIYYVDADATGANDGSSWTDAFNYLQDALAAATRGDEIQVAQGIYRPDENAVEPEGTGDREATFQLITGVTLKGGYAGVGEPDPNERDIANYETILSGDLAGNDVDVNDPCDLLTETTRSENSYHVVTDSATDNTARLDGFTITSGNANSDEDVHYCGAGMYSDFGNSTVLNCTFADNSADYGGGMYNYGSSPTLNRCTFRANFADAGGGMCISGSPMLINCTFTANSARWAGGIMCIGLLILNNCTFRDNRADFGAAICSDAVELDHCAFHGNRAGAGGAVSIFGGKMAIVYDASVTNCIFSGNFARWGGAIQAEACHGALTNCTFAGNSALNGGNALACDSYLQGSISKIELTNCILWDGGDEIWNNNTSTINITYSDVQGSWPGQANIGADPCFVTPGYWGNRDDPNIVVEPNDPNALWVYGDYHLLSDSPCIDAGDPNYVPEPNETDLDGRPRVVGGRIDMGAYEYSPPIPAEVRIVPRSINPASMGKWITCYIWLPEDYTVADIDPNSVFLEDEIQAESLRVDEQQQVAIVRFSRSEVQSALGRLEPGDVELTVSCELSDGTRFEGTDTIRVIDKGKKK